MSHYAKVLDGTVLEIIVAEQEFIDTYVDSTAGKWIQTSYNTSGGIHSTGGTPLRKNYANIGGVYDEERDAFYEKQGYPSWNLNEDTCLWEAPSPKPEVEGQIYEWNESNLSWDQVVL